MDVVIFCGGRGTRLAEFTDVLPKPMVPIGNKPILWHIMKIFSSFGHNKFVLTLGYKGNEIKRHFIENHWVENDFELSSEGFTNFPKPKEKWNISLLDTGLDTKTQKRLFLAKEHIKTSRFLLTYGDGVADINLDELIKRHEYLNKKYGVLVTATILNPTTRWGIVETTEELITNFNEKPRMKEFINVGFMVVERGLFDHMNESDVMFEEDLLPKLAKEGKLGFYHHTGFWECMDTYRDYTVLNKLWKDKKPWKIWKD